MPIIVYQFTKYNTQVFVVSSHVYSFPSTGFGIGGGSTYVDTDCRRIKNARELWNMGMKSASLALMCNDPENRIALEVTGYSCPPVKE